MSFTLRYVRIPAIKGGDPSFWCSALNESNSSFQRIETTWTGEYAAF